MNHNEQTQPFNMKAEQAVIYSLALDGNLFDQIRLKGRDFHHLANRIVFDHAEALHKEGKPIDLVTLENRVTQAGDLERIGGEEYFRQLTYSTATAAYIDYYASIVANDSKRRRLIRACQDSLAAAWDTSKDVDATIAEGEAALQGIETGEYSGGYRSLDDAMLDAMVWVDDIAQGRRRPCVETGLPHLDYAIGGLFDGELTTLAARTSGGKTALGLQIAAHVARECGLVYYATLEMKDHALALRVLCGDSGVSLNAIRSGKIGPKDVERIQKAAEQNRGLPVVLQGRPGLTVAGIRRDVRRLVPKGLRLAVIDYLGKLTPSDRSIPRHLQIGAMTGELKALALETETPILLLAQLSRLADVVDAEGNYIEPRLSHLKESGDVEQDSDAVWLLHRPQRAGDAILTVAKNRQGEQGQFTLAWDGARTRFSRKTTVKEGLP